MIFRRAATLTSSGSGSSASIDNTLTRSAVWSMLRSSGHDVGQALRIVVAASSVTVEVAVPSNSGPQPSKLKVRGSSPLARFGVLRCAGLHNVALCTELCTVETAGKRALILHRIAHICTRWRPARSRWRYAIRTAVHIPSVSVTPQALPNRGE